MSEQYVVRAHERPEDDLVHGAIRSGRCDNILGRCRLAAGLFVEWM